MKNDDTDIVCSSCWRWSSNVTIAVALSSALLSIPADTSVQIR